MTNGKIYLIPNTLGGESTKDIIPQEVAEIATNLKTFAVEDVKSAKRMEYPCPGGDQMRAGVSHLQYAFQRLPSCWKLVGRQG